jgi:hypothetical protein
MWLVIGIGIGVAVGYVTCAVLTCGRMMDISELEQRLSDAEARCAQLKEMLVMAIPTSLEAEEEP